MAPKTSEQKAIDNLEKVLRVQYEQMNNIKREGDVIVVPQIMTLPDASKAIMKYHESQNETAEKIIEAECHPHDGLVCLKRAMEETFGSFVGVSEWKASFFGRFLDPAKSLSVPVGFDQVESVPFGAVAVPGLPFKMEVHIDENDKDPLKGKLIVVFRYKQLYEPMTLRIESLMRDYLKENSIFKGKAINDDYTFIDLSGRDIVIYSYDEERQLEADIFTPIRKLKQLEKMREQVRRTILLAGPFGTGKTLTARVAARLCEEHSWSFMNVRTGGSIERALAYARKNQPAVVFFEDIDSVTSGDRDEGINKILNEIDGFLSKNAKVIVILTTNHEEYIHKGMLRPGRVDRLIRLGSLDKDAVMEFVRAYGGDQLVGDLDDSEIYEASLGYPPAFVARAVNLAKSYALIESDDAQIASEDIVSALRGLRPQYELMMADQKKHQTTLDATLGEMMKGAVTLVLENEVGDEYAVHVADKVIERS